MVPHPPLLLGFGDWYIVEDVIAILNLDNFQDSILSTVGASL
jgi:hypothetical protein